MRRFFSKVFVADSAYSVADKLWAIFFLLFPSAAAGVMGFIASESAWFWERFGLLGVGAMAIAVFFAVAAALALLTEVFRYWDSRVVAKNAPLTPADPPPKDLAPPPVKVSKWVSPLVAARLWTDAGYERNRTAAEALHKGLSQQYTAALAVVLAAPSDEREIKNREAEELKKHLGEALESLRRHTWDQSLDLAYRLEHGQFVAEGFMNPEDRKPTRINQAEWRKFKLEEDSFRTQKVTLGNITYTGLVIGKPE